MGFAVTTDELRAAQGFVADLAGDVNAELLGVHDEITQLLADGWLGTAAAGFNAGWRDWRDGATDLLDALGRIGVLLALSAEHYDGTDTYAGVELDMAGSEL